MRPYNELRILVRARLCEKSVYTWQLVAYYGYAMALLKLHYNFGGASLKREVESLRGYKESQGYNPEYLDVVATCVKKIHDKYPSVEKLVEKALVKAMKEARAQGEEKKKG